MRAEMDEQGLLMERLARALRGRPLEEVLPAPRALVALEAAVAASGEVALARRAAEKLRAGGRLLPEETEALEVGLRMVRPALQVEAGGLPAFVTPLLAVEARERLSSLLEGVACLGWSWEFPLATGFQVAPRVLATSAHVAEKLLRERADLEQGHFVARFDARGGGPARVIPIASVLALHPREDVALLALVSEGPLPQGLPLARELESSPGEEVLVVGYPLYSADDPPFVDALFENVYGVKRASPGELLGVEVERLYHDCTTLSGNSGSPVIDLGTGLVVGVHASGRFAFRNTAVSTRALHETPGMRELVATWCGDGRMCPSGGRFRPAEVLR